MSRSKDDPFAEKRAYWSETFEEKQARLAREIEELTIQMRAQRGQ